MPHRGTLRPLAACSSNGPRRDAPSPNERQLLDNVTKRVRLWKEVEPYYNDADRGPYKSAESRGTESVLNALILASPDAQGGQLSNDAHTALDNMWAEQQTAGNRKAHGCGCASPMSRGKRTIRTTMEPRWPRSRRTHRGTIAQHLKSKLTSRCCANTSPANSQPRPPSIASFLWAAAKLPGLLEPDRQKAIIAELLEKQQADGGWSLSSLSGDWKRADGTSQETTSDGYATGLITFVLQQAAISHENAKLRGGLAWLAANQDKAEGSWAAYSLNKNKENHISPETALFMNDAATSYAVLSLTAADRR